METKVLKLENGFLCLICDKSIKWLHSIRTHLRDYHMNCGEQYQCPECHIICMNRNKFRSHAKKHKHVRIDYDQCKVELQY